MAKKRRETASRKQQRHDETCMCKKCRAKTEAMFYRNRTRKARGWDDDERTDYARGGE